MTTMTTKARVIQLLTTVLDPELKIDIVSLGLIYDVKVRRSVGGNENIVVTMTLTTPGCPLAPIIDRMIKEALEPLGAVVVLDLVWDPPWVKDMMSEEARLKLGIL